MTEPARGDGQRMPVVVLPTGFTVPSDVALRAATWDGAGHPAPTTEELAAAEVFVLPYMGPATNAALTVQMPRVQVVQALTAGVDGITEHLPAGVTLCNAVGVHDASTAELAVGLMIAAQRGLDDAARDTVVGRWDHRTRRTVADIVVLAVPLTDTTRGLLDARRLALMPDGALVVNVARGPVIDPAALVAEVTAGRLRAALDVTDPEPLPADHPLWRAPGVLITPHVGGDTTAFRPRAQRLLNAQLRRYCAGQPLVGVVSGARPRSLG